MSESFFDKVVGLQPATLLKRNTEICFSLMKILQTPSFQNTFGRLLMLCGKTKSHLEEQIYCITIIIIFRLQKGRSRRNKNFSEEEAT